MTTGTLNFDDDHYTALIRGETFHRVLNCTNPDGTNIDFTGYSAKMQIRKNYGGTLIAELNTVNNSIVLATGSITLNLSAAMTDDIPVGKYLYDLFLIVGNNTTRLLAGEIHIKDRITDTQ